MGYRKNKKYNYEILKKKEKELLLFTQPKTNKEEKHAQDHC